MLLNAAFCHYAQWQANCQCLPGLLLCKAAVSLGVNLLSLINEFLDFCFCQTFKRLDFTLSSVHLLFLKALDWCEGMLLFFGVFFLKRSCGTNVRNVNIKVGQFLYL